MLMLCNRGRESPGEMCTLFPYRRLREKEIRDLSGHSTSRINSINRKVDDIFHDRVLAFIQSNQEKRKTVLKYTTHSEY